jgi:hypothetical protein
MGPPTEAALCILDRARCLGAARFTTCCLRSKNGVATTPAKLAFGWLACLYREGANVVEMI